MPRPLVPHTVGLAAYLLLCAAIVLCAGVGLAFLYHGLNAA